MFESLLTDLVKLDRIEVINENGVAERRVTTLKQQVLCLIEERSGELRTQGGTEALEFDAVAWFSAPEDIRPSGEDAGQTDRITVLESPRIGEGVAFEVVHARSSPAVQHHVECRLRRVTPKGGDG